MAVFRYIIAGSEDGRRLDALLAERLDRSRHEVARLFAGRRVCLDGRVAAKGERAAIGATVEVDMDAEAPGTVAPLPPVVFEDEAVVAVNKPRATHCVANRPDDLETLARSLAEAYPSMAELRPPDFGLVHRLDYCTTGILLAAKTAADRATLRAAFGEHRVIKTYRAVCAGSPPESFTVEAPIGHPGRRNAHVRVGSGRTPTEARTEFRTLDVAGGYALVEAMTRTGARHQIRAHAAHAGFVLVGDTLYGGPAIEGGCFHLHAYAVEFPHPRSGEIIRLTCEPPSGFFGTE